MVLMKSQKEVILVLLSLSHHCIVVEMKKYHSYIENYTRIDQSLFYSLYFYSLSYNEMYELKR